MANAIEGYIGGARFSIIVEPKCEAEAIRIVRAIKGRRNNARVIQGAKAQRDAERLQLSGDSIVEVMEFDNKIVEYYIKASYGAVLRVDNEETLKKTPRGIVANGLGSGNYSMFRCDLDDADLVFGQGARERALIAKQQQLEVLLEQSRRAEESHRQAGTFYDLVEKFKTVQCSEIIKQMIALYRRREQSERQLANIDLSDYQDLEQQLGALSEQHSEVETQGNKLNEDIGALKNKVDQLKSRIDKLAGEQDELAALQEKHERAVLDIGNIYSGFDGEGQLLRADDLVRQGSSDFNFEEKSQDLLRILDDSERALHELILLHNQTCNSYNSILYHNGNGERNGVEYFKSIVGIRKNLEGIYSSLKNNVLVGKNEKIRTLKDSFNTAFVTNLCHSIYQSINDGKRILQDLNKELEHHRFGSDQERFYFAMEWLPEFKEYHRFFKEVIDTPNLGDGSTLFDSELSEKSCQVRDKLLAMLLAKDELIALRELQRISDYRNYRQYEIFKEPLNKEPIALSKYGTGSGGQLETPAYIIRSAAVTSAFRFNDGNTHCRMVLVDEAFSKMDEVRSREVINYLTETLGLQLIFIMPTSKSGPFMDLISHQIVFSKCPVIEPIGELKTRVLVDRKVCDQAKIEKLWADHRKVVRDQGMLDFMEDVI